jgi:molybdopterin synthase catalytic subunit
MNKTILNESKLFEKIEIDWFTSKMMKNRKNEFRPFYREIVEHILKETPIIKKTFIQNHNQTQTQNSRKYTMKQGR